jgi:hypothetical protein
MAGEWCVRGVVVVGDFKRLVAQVEAGVVRCVGVVVVVVPGLTSAMVPSAVSW